MRRWIRPLGIDDSNSEQVEGNTDFGEKSDAEDDFCGFSPSDLIEGDQTVRLAEL